MDGGHVAAVSEIVASNLSPKQLQKAHGVLQVPFFCTIVLKDPNGQSSASLIHRNAMQVPIGLTKKDRDTTMFILPVDAPACVPFPIDSNYNQLIAYTLREDVGEYMQ